jgi:hypothetical protein
MGSLRVEEKHGGQTEETGRILPNSVTPAGTVRGLMVDGWELGVWGKAEMLKTES